MTRGLLFNELQIGASYSLKLHSGDTFDFKVVGIKPYPSHTAVPYADIETSEGAKQTKTAVWFNVNQDNITLIASAEE